MKKKEGEGGSKIIHIPQVSYLATDMSDTTTKTTRTSSSPRAAQQETSAINECTSREYIVQALMRLCLKNQETLLSTRPRNEIERIKKQPRNNNNNTNMLEPRTSRKQTHNSRTHQRRSEGHIIQARGLVHRPHEPPPPPPPPAKTTTSIRAVHKSQTETPTSKGVKGTSSRLTRPSTSRTTTAATKDNTKEPQNNKQNDGNGSNDKDSPTEE